MPFQNPIILTEIKEPCSMMAFPFVHPEETATSEFHRDVSASLTSMLFPDLVKEVFSGPSLAT